MRTLLCCAALTLFAGVAVAEDTPAAAKTRKLLKKKITVEFKDTRFEDALNEIKEEVKGLKIVYGAGVSRNKMVTYKAKDKSVEAIFDELFKKIGGLGYVVISKKGNAYDGSVQVKQGDERGTEKDK